MGDFGFATAKKDINVLTNIDPNNLIFSSKYNTLKVLAKANTTVSTNGSGNGLTQIEHGLGYAPAYYIYRKGTATWQRENNVSPFSTTHANAYSSNVGMGNSWFPSNDAIEVYTDETYLYIEASSAQANTTYNFLYIIFSDLAQSFNEESTLGSSSVGIKIAREGNNVLESAQHFKMAFSTRFRSLKYIPEKSSTTSLTLPLIFSSASDTSSQEATYVDINHGLGYPPFFLAYFTGDTFTDALETGMGFPLTDVGSPFYEVSSFCDATKIRITFFRLASYGVFTGVQTLQQETINIKYLIFDEDLSDTT
jgi:hypothetical protein